VHVIFVQRAGVVPVCVPAGGADAHLRAISKYRISRKEKCISCNGVHFGVHQGIDVRFCHKDCR